MVSSDRFEPKHTDDYRRIEDHRDGFVSLLDSDVLGGLFGADRRIYTLAFARMADSIGNSFLIIVLPLYIGSGVITGNTFGLGAALITGIILSAFGFLSTIVQPFAGRFSDRTGKRRAFIIAGLVVLTVANFAYSLAGSYAAMLVIRALQGVGVAVTIPATVALVNELATDDSRGGDLGIFNTFRFIGFAAGPILAGVVINGGSGGIAHYEFAGIAMTGFEAAFYIASLGALVAVVLLTLFVEDPHPDEQDAEASKGELGIAVFDRHHDSLLDPVFSVGVALLFVAMGIALLSPLETQINEHLGQGPRLFGIEFAVFIVAQVFLQAPVGSWSDKYGRKPFILGGLIVLVPATLAQGFVGSPVLMILTRLVQGAAAAVAFAPGFALAGDIADAGNSGTTFSVLTMAFTLGTAVGPLTAGYLIGFGYAVPFAFGAALAAVGAVIVYTQVNETVMTTDEASGGAKAAGQD